MVNLLTDCWQDTDVSNDHPFFVLLCKLKLHQQLSCQYLFLTINKSFFIRFSFVQIIKLKKIEHTLIELRSSRLNFLNSSTRYNNWSDVNSFQPPNAMPSRVGAASRSFSNTQSTFLIFQLLKFRSLLPRNRCSMSHFRLSSVRWRSRGGHAERSTWRQSDGEMATWRQREQTRLRRDNVGRVLVSEMV